MTVCNSACKYHRRWLLSECTSNSGQQKYACNKHTHLTGSVHFIMCVEGGAKDKVLGAKCTYDEEKYFLFSND